MSTASLAIGGTETAGGGRLVDREPRFRASWPRGTAGVVTPRFEAS